MPIVHGLPPEQNWSRDKFTAQEVLSLVAADLNNDGIPDALDVRILGKVLTTAVPASPPNASPPKTASAKSVLASLAVVDTSYVVTVGKALTIQTFRAGAQGARTSQNPPATAKIELFYDPLGTGVGMTLIDVIYCWAGSVIFPESYTTPVGDGVIAVRLRRTNFGNDTVETYGRWDGYEA